MDSVGAALGLVTVFSLYKYFTKSPNVPLPPGPKGRPIIGNMFDMPTYKPWVTYAEWGRTWGDIVSVTILGQTIVILNSYDAAITMLEKKGAIYSDRPLNPMAQISGLGSGFSLQPYGPRFRTFRKYYMQLVGSHTTASKFHGIQEAEAKKFLVKLVGDSPGLLGHVKCSISSIILQVAYGYQLQEKDDPFVGLVAQANKNFVHIVTPGKFLVNRIPILQYVPDWFPGTGWKQVAKQYSAVFTRLADEPFQFVKDQIAKGMAPPSFTSELLSREGGLAEGEEDDVRWTAASLHGAGAETSSGMIIALFRIFLLFPEVQAKAQAEIDAVVGRDRLPKVADRERMPYMSAVVLEALRWHSFTPMALPHRLTVDDVHDGYFIPKGSIIFANTWNMSHDPATYANPMEFIPERFIATPDHQPERDPREIVFGFGRRICPGRFMAEANIFIIVATSLAAFSITKYVDEKGVVEEPDMEVTSGFSSHVTPFRCTVKPRFEGAEGLYNGSVGMEA